MDLRETLAKWGITVDEGLLSQALVHGSYAHEHPEESESNQRLEYLGDAVLELVVSEHLFRNLPSAAEGILTQLRASQVCTESLAQAACDLELGKELRLGRGEEEGGGREKTSLLADSFEAVIGAIYLSSGLDGASCFVRRALGRRMELLGEEEANFPRDPKSELQEIIHAREKGSAAPEYRLLASKGPPHSPSFRTEVCLGGRSLGRGSGRTKQESERAAARAALRKIKEEVEDSSRDGANREEADRRDDMRQTSELGGTTGSGCD